MDNKNNFVGYVCVCDTKDQVPGDRVDILAIPRPVWCGCVDLCGNLVWTRVNLCVDLRVVWLCGPAWISCVELRGLLCGHLYGVFVWTCVDFLCGTAWISVWTSARCGGVDLCGFFPVLRPE